MREAPKSSPSKGNGLQQNWEHYDFFGHFRLTLEKHNIPPALKKQLALYATSDSSRQDIELVLCRTRHTFPKGISHRIGGRYKGIHWEIGLEYSTPVRAERIYFHAPLFTTFLVTRMVILPCIKRVVVKHGGFSIIGSAFRYQEKTVLLFGCPGSGKTSLLLQALSRGAELIGDNELVITREGNIANVFQDIELRYQSVRATPFWTKLSIWEKTALRFYALLSLLTFHTVSFNVLVSPEQLGLKKDESPSVQGETILIHVKQDLAPTKMEAGEMISAIAKYEASYRRLFGSTFFSEQDFLSGGEAINGFLARCSLWQLATMSDLNNVVNME